jgi:hypothetical protein
VPGAADQHEKSGLEGVVGVGAESPAAHPEDHRAVTADQLGERLLVGVAEEVGDEAASLRGSGSAARRATTRSKFVIEHASVRRRHAGRKYIVRRPASASMISSEDHDSEWGQFRG